MKCKQAFIHGPKDLRIEEVELPELKENQLLVKVESCGVCKNCKEGLMPSACLNMRELGFRPDSPGGMGEYLIIEQDYVYRIPDDWSYEMGSWVETFSVGYFGIWGNGSYIDASDTAHQGLRRNEELDAEVDPLHQRDQGQV